MRRYQVTAGRNGGITAQAAGGAEFLPPACVVAGARLQTCSSPGMLQRNGICAESKALPESQLQEKLQNIENIREVSRKCSGMVYLRYLGKHAWYFSRVPSRHNVTGEGAGGSVQSINPRQKTVRKRRAGSQHRFARYAQRCRQVYVGIIGRSSR